MKIDRERVKKGLAELEEIEISGNIAEVHTVGEIYLSGKLIEPMSELEIIKIVSHGFHFHPAVIKELAKRFVGKIPSQFVSASVDELKQAIKSSWLNTNARADLLKLNYPKSKLEEINNEQIEALVSDIKLINSVGKNAGEEE